MRGVTPEFTHEVEELIRETLESAKTIIKADDKWTPLVHVIHPNGVETIRVDGVSAVEKDSLTNIIDSRLKLLDGTVAVMLADLCIPPCSEDQRVSGQTLDQPADRDQALLLAIWGPNIPAAFGLQIYETDSSEEIIFRPIAWTDSATAWLLRLALTSVTGHCQVSATTRG